ncbi:MAG: hypothetical protein RLZZ407_1721 [Pseudomonadota bacterium]|jgi:SAM-dependent methyltransferase
MGAKVLATALQAGVIDRLIVGPLSMAELSRRYAFAPAGRSFVAAGLKHAGIVDVTESVMHLSPRFRTALQWRDLLEARLELAAIVLPDFTELTSALLGTGEDFMAQSATFDLFRYDRAKHRSDENRAATERWVRLLSVLSRYETDGLLQLLERGQTNQIIDVGGNGGVLAQILCGAWPGSQAQVFDLPVVCDIGRDMQSGSGSGAQMVTFVEGDLRHDPLPKGADLIIFKSVLHDWPDRDIAAFLSKASESLKTGGRIAIFERTPFTFDAAMPAFHDLPNLMFMHVLRPHALYAGILDSLGMASVQQKQIELDMPFCLTQAVKH